MGIKINRYASKIFCCVALATTFITNANAGEGFIVGLQAGMSDNHFGRSHIPLDGSSPIVITVKPNTTGIAGRLYMGYDFTYGGWEFGLARYAAAQYASSIANASIHESQIDIVGKGILPIGESGISLYGKAGFAFLRATRSRKITASDQHSVTSGIYPTFAAGVAYAITDRSVFDLSASKVISKSSNLPSVNFVALGFSYHFSNSYCGQFLC